MTVTFGQFGCQPEESSMPKMNNVKTIVLCGLLMAGLVLGVGVRQAEARPYFFGWWTEAYPDVTKAQQVKSKVKCNVCHYGASKKNRNAYGKALQEAFGKKLKNNPADKMIFTDSLKKVEDEKSQTEGKTFGDLLKAKELPATPPESK
jgi:hypothetical protein